MSQDWYRRDLLKLMGLGGLTFASGLAGAACASPAPAGPVPAAAPKQDDFFFLQLSDTHWGYSGPADPVADTILEHAVAAINEVDLLPDFVVFTGDLTHATGDPTVRRDRMKHFRDIAAKLKVKDLRFLPGEHDAGPDQGEAYRELFGEPTYAFDHRGVHFVALDNASRPGGALGDPQLSWLEADLARLAPGGKLVVLAHRPLFDLAPEWEWTTRDGARAIEILQRHDAATVFYGHIHQEHHRQTGRVAHHAARSLVFPLPAPGSAPTKQPLPWDPASPDHGLGYRSIEVGAAGARPREIPFRT